MRRKIYRLLVAALCVTFSAVFLSAGLAAADPVRDGMLHLELDSAVPYTVRRGETWTTQPRTLTVDLMCRGGRWQASGWAWMAQLPGQEQPVAEVAVVDHGATLAITLRLDLKHNRTLPCSVGGKADCRIELRRDGDRFTGSFLGSTSAAEDPLLLMQLGLAWGEQRQGEPVRPKALPKELDERLLSQAVNGEVAGRLLAAPPLTPMALAPGEHPRLFFRKADLPRLRAFAATDIGKRLVALASEQLARDRNGFTFHAPGAPAGGEGYWAAGHAMLYQLTGDRIHAERAEAACIAMYSGAWYGGWHVLADRLLGFAVAYDLCYDAFDPGFRDVLGLFLERQARQCASLERGSNPLFLGEDQTFLADMLVGMPTTPDDRWVVRYRAAAGMAALAILGDPVPALREPPRIANARVIAPAADYQPPVGVPVVPFLHDAMQCRWLMNGPFFNEVAEPLHAIGGFAGARPLPGQMVRYRGFDLPFRQAYIPESLYPRNQSPSWAYHGRFGGFQTGAKLAAAAAGDDRSGRRLRIAIYNVLDNDLDRVVQVRNNLGYASFGVVTWINGVRCQDGDLVRLAPGLYPVMTDLWVTGGYTLQAPRLYEYSARDEARDRALYESGAAVYAKANRITPGVDLHAAILARSVRRFLDVTQGDSGWTDASGGAFTSITKNKRLSAAEGLGLAVPFLSAYRNVTGLDLVTGTSIPKIAALAIATHGEALQQCDLYQATIPFILPFLSAQDQPLARSYLERNDWCLSNPFRVIPLLTSLPNAPTPDPAVAQAQAALPSKTLHDQRYGAFFTVSGWDPQRDAMTSIQLANGPQRFTAPGTIFLRAFGRIWTPSRNSVPTVERAFPASPAKLLHSAFTSDGSGVVSMAVDGFRDVQDGAAVSITWTRSVGVDYSGASGSPYLIAIADRFVGAADRSLAWRVALGRASYQVQERGFVAWPDSGKQDQFNLQTTVLAPSQANLWIESGAGKSTLRRQLSGTTFANVGVTAILSLEDPDQWKEELAQEQFDAYAAAFEQTRSTDDLPALDLDDPDTDEAVLKQREQKAKAVKQAGKQWVETTSDAKQVQLIRRRLAWSQDPERTGCFFVVLTIQEGKAPQVVVSGEGLSATAVVGKQIIRFDGTKIVFGP